MRAPVFGGSLVGLLAIALFIIVAGNGLIGDASVEHAEEIVAVPGIEPSASVPQVQDEAPLERIEPRAPLGPLGAPEDPATRPPRAALLHRPVVLSAGLVEAAGHRIELEGVEPLPADAMCEAQGRDWPCGIHARTAFRNFLRGRAISCTVPGVPGDDVVASRCMVGTADPAAWLVEQGWVRARPGSPYEDAGIAARDARRGVHGSPPGP